MIEEIERDRSVRNFWKVIKEEKSEKQEVAKSRRRNGCHT